MSIEDTVLAMTVAVMEVARTGHDALVGHLVENGLTQDEALEQVKGVIEYRLAPNARRVRVAQLRATGLSQRAIAAELGVGVATVHEDLHRSEPNTNEHADRSKSNNDDPAVVPPGIAEEEGELDLDTTTPEAVAESTDVWLADLRKYISGIVHVPPPPQVDPVLYRRVRRSVVRVLSEALTQLARDKRA